MSETIVISSDDEDIVPCLHRKDQDKEKITKGKINDDKIPVIVSVSSYQKAADSQGQKKDKIEISFSNSPEVANSNSVIYASGQDLPPKKLSTTPSACLPSNFDQNILDGSKTNRQIDGSQHKNSELNLVLDKIVATLNKVQHQPNTSPPLPTPVAGVSTNASQGKDQKVTLAEKEQLKVKSARVQRLRTRHSPFVKQTIQKKKTSTTQSISDSIEACIKSHVNSSCPLTLENPIAEQTKCELTSVVVPSPAAALPANRKIIDILPDPSDRGEMEPEAEHCNTDDTSTEVFQPILSEKSNDGSALFKKFTLTCAEMEPNEIDRQKAQAKLEKWKGRCNKDYLNSKTFQNLLITQMEILGKKSPNVYLSIKIVLEALKENQEETMNTSSNSKEEKLLSGKKNRQIKKLQNAITQLNEKIKRLETMETDLNDEENSSYLYLQKCRERICKLFNKLCEISGESSDVGRVINKKITFNGTRFVKVNQLLEKWLNETRRFPDFYEVKAVIEKHAGSLELNLSPNEIGQLAAEAFRNIGKTLQRMRRLDLTDTLMSVIDDKVQRDPAETDPELTLKLQHNRRMYGNREQQIIDKFAEREQMEGPESSESFTNEEEEEQEKNDKVTPKTPCENILSRLPDESTSSKANLIVKDLNVKTLKRLISVASDDEEQQSSSKENSLIINKKQKRARLMPVNKDAVDCVNSEEVRESAMPSESNNIPVIYINTIRLEWSQPNVFSDPANFYSMLKKPNILTDLSNRVEKSGKSLRSLPRFPAKKFSTTPSRQLLERPYKVKHFGLPMNGDANQRTNASGEKTNQNKNGANRKNGPVGEEENNGCGFTGEGDGNKGNGEDGHSRDGKDMHNEEDDNEDDNDDDDDDDDNDKEEEPVINDDYQSSTFITSDMEKQEKEVVDKRNEQEGEKNEVERIKQKKETENKKTDHHVEKPLNDVQHSEPNFSEKTADRNQENRSEKKPSERNEKGNEHLTENVKLKRSDMEGSSLENGDDTKNLVEDKNSAVSNMVQKNELSKVAEDKEIDGHLRGSKNFSSVLDMDVTKEINLEGHFGDSYLAQHGEEQMEISAEVVEPEGEMAEEELGGETDVDPLADVDSKVEEKKKADDDDNRIEGTNGKEKGRKKRKPGTRARSKSLRDERTSETRPQTRAASRASAAKSTESNKTVTTDDSDEIKIMTVKLVKNKIASPLKANQAATSIVLKKPLEITADERVQRFLQGAASQGIAITRKRAPPPLSDDAKDALERLKKMKGISATRVSRQQTQPTSSKSSNLNSNRAGPSTSSESNPILKKLVSMAPQSNFNTPTSKAARLTSTQRIGTPRPRPLLNPAACNMTPKIMAVRGAPSQSLKSPHFPPMPRLRTYKPPAVTNPPRLRSPLIRPPLRPPVRLQSPSVKPSPPPPPPPSHRQANNAPKTVQTVVLD